MKKVFVCSLMVSSLLLFTGCNVLANGKSVHVINDDNNVSLNKVALEKISHYKNMVGVDWLDNDQLLSQHLNIHGESVINADLNQFNLKTGKSKLILRKQDFADNKLVLSPDKKHVLCKILNGERESNYIIDLSTKKHVRVKLEGSMDIFEANWVDNQHVIVSNDSNKTYIADVTGKISEVKTPYEISSPTKIKDELYFIHNMQLISFHLKTHKTKVLVKDQVAEFTFSPNKDKMAVIKNSKNGQMLTVTDIAKGKQATIASGKIIGGAGWSPDQSKLAYFIMKSEQSRPQLNVTDLKTLKTTLLSVNVVGYFKSSPVIWSPSGDKLLINSVDEHTGAPGVDILTLKK